MIPARLTASIWDARSLGTDREPLAGLTVGEVLQQAAERAPDRTALVAGVDDPAARRRWTFAELLDEATRSAHWLLERLDPGDRVAIWAPNEPEWVIAMFGAALAGAVVVPVNPAYKTGEAGHVLGMSEAAVVLFSEEHRGNPIAAHLDQLRPQLPALRHAVELTQLSRLATSATAAPLPRVRGDDLAQIQFTSGTTGFPKGACLRHAGITDNAWLMHRRLGLGPGDVYVNPNPMFHLGGCGLGTLGPARLLATQVLVHHFEPGLFLELLASERATATGGVPTMLISLMEHPSFGTTDLSALRTISSGGAVVPPELVRRIESRLGVRYSTMFGQTEASPGITQTHPDDSPEDKGETVGQPLEHMSVKIVGADGEVVPLGAQGELVARSPVVMAGYWRLPEATAATLDDEGWLHTGDLATMDERGYCRIVGRVKDMITRGGENIYPREIEDVLFEHPDVAEVAVVGVPDERLGEVVAAFIRPEAGHEVDIDELRELVGSRLARHKLPAHWTIVDRLPQTGSGKVQKHVLRESWIDDRRAEG
jgi:fatty-acyl-CoA synthase